MFDQIEKLLKSESQLQTQKLDDDPLQLQYYKPEFVEECSHNKSFYGTSIYFDAIAKTSLKLDPNMEYKDYLIKKSIKDTLNTLDDTLFKTKKISQNSTIRENLTNTVYEVYKIQRYNPKYQVKIVSKNYFKKHVLLQESI